MQGKVALITGGTSGIGLATAQLFAEHGAMVAVVGRNAERGANALTQIPGDDAIFIQADVTQPADMREVVLRVIEKFGRLDIAVNNAGSTGERKLITDQTDDDFDHFVDFNLRSVWLGLRYQLPPMIAQGSGAIVNVSSVKGMTGIAGYGLYSATKHAVNGLTKSAALEVAEYGVRVNAVCPAAIRTPMLENGLRPIFNDEDADANFARYGAMLPIGRSGSANEAAQAILWLCSDAASFITGAMLPVDGGSLAKGVP
jgi:NAD(P)-dependent dehydrogenase (short-subunit alcohol dehydrogenase family)